MCIAIAKPKGVILSKLILENCFENNPDGAGYAFAKNGKVEIKKGFFTFKDFWKSFSAAQSKNDGAMLVHFRVASSGIINEYNCHPWRIDENHAMIHNGTIDRFIYSQSPISDTGHFTESVLKPMFKYNDQFFKEKFARCLIEETIRSWNKVVILGADGEFVIYNESKGQWMSKSWYSNSSFYPRWNQTTQSYSRKKKEQNGLAQKRYRIWGGNKILTMAEINELKKLYNCKINDLIEKEIIIIEDSRSTTVSHGLENAPLFNTPEYSVWWAKRFDKIRQEAQSQQVE